MAKKSNPSSSSKPTGKPTNNPGAGEIIIKGNVPQMRNPPPPPPKKKD